MLAAGSFVGCSDGGSGTSGPVGASGNSGSGGSNGTGGSGGASSGSGGGSATGGSTGTGGSNGDGGSAGSSSEAGAGDDAATADDGGGSIVPDAGSGAQSLFDGKSLDGWIQYPPDSWTIMDDAMYSKGTARGYIYTKDDYTDYRIIFTLRQVSGDHKPTVLVYNTRPPPNIDAMGGVQFQPPQGGHWDYRLPTKDHNNAGNEYFTKVGTATISEKEWARCEILVLATGVARMACCQLPGGTGTCKATEILDFKDDPMNLTTKGPFAIQIHNGGIHDEYKDLTIEANPAVKDLITTK